MASSLQLANNMLIAMEADIQLQLRFIMQHKMFLSKASGNFVNLKADYEPGSYADRVLEARVHQLTEAEKVLDMKVQDLQARLKPIQSQREDLQRQISESNQRSYKNAYSAS